MKCGAYGSSSATEGRKLMKVGGAVKGGGDYVLFFFEPGI